MLFGLECEKIFQLKQISLDTQILDTHNFNSTPREYTSIIRNIQYSSIFKPILIGNSARKQREISSKLMKMQSTLNKSIQLFILSKVIFG